MMSRCFTWDPFWWISRNQYITLIGLFYKNWKILRRVSDWWRHLRKHLGTNTTNYFMYQWVGLSYKAIHGGFFLNHRFFYSLISEGSSAGSNFQR